MPTYVQRVYSPLFKTELSLPFHMSIQAGRPSKGDCDLFDVLDFNKDIIRHPESTVFVEIEGEPMEEDGIFPTDLLVVDLKGVVTDGCIVVVEVNNQLVVRRLSHQTPTLRLVTQDPEKKPDLKIFGVVEFSIHRVSRMSRRSA